MMVVVTDVMVLMYRDYCFDNVGQPWVCWWYWWVGCSAQSL
jgi:hypothetical protein